MQATVLRDGSHEFLVSSNLLAQDSSFFWYSRFNFIRVYHLHIKTDKEILGAGIPMITVSLPQAVMDIWIGKVIRPTAYDFPAPSSLWQGLWSDLLPAV